MSVTIRLLPRASRDLATLSERTQNQILAKLELLRTFPEMGAVMFDAFKGYRALLVARNRYRVIYRIKTHTLIEVAYIRHCARQIGVRIIRSDPERQQ